MTPAEYSIWLMPDAARELTLASTVARLCGVLGGETFTPHVTLQGDLAIPLETLGRWVGALAQRVTVQRWRVHEVQCSAHFFRCLYLRFGAEPGFQALQGAVQAFTQTAHGLSPFAHLSLAYGQAGEDHQRARGELSREFAAQEIVFDRLAISRSSSNVPIADWLCLAQYPLTSPQ